jgi:hypothetical protein
MRSCAEGDRPREVSSDEIKPNEAFVREINRGQS